MFGVLSLQSTKKYIIFKYIYIYIKRRKKEIEWNEEEKAPIRARKAKMDFSKSPLENKAAPNPGRVSCGEFYEGKTR